MTSFQEGSSRSQTPPIADLVSCRRRDVTYGSCGSCGYALNLWSCCRNTTNIGSRYGKAMRKGVVSFLSIDESRFSHVDELPCMPFLDWKKFSRGLFGRRRTRLLCRKCGSVIGSASSAGSDDRRKYSIKLGALQPMFAVEESALLPPCAGGYLRERICCEM